MSNITGRIGRRTKFAAAVLTAFAIAGCASLGLGGAFKEPIVTFKDLRVAGIGLSGGSLDAYITSTIRMGTGWMRRA